MKTKNTVLLFGLLAAFGAAAQEAAPIAGLRPFERPAGAPVIQSFDNGGAWRAQAVRGLGEPLTGVEFLKDQGAWYTPFNHPNMPGHYDIRGLHQAPKKE